MNNLANDFFKHGDKGYSENLNDGLLVGNAFSWTLSIGLPSDTEGVFPNSSSVVKAKVCDVSATPNSNLGIGSTITNSSGSEQVYRLTVYPNFNRFGGFTSVSVTGDADLYIANKGASSPIVDNLDYSDLGNVPELKVLKEYDIVLTLSDGDSVSGLSFVLQSKAGGVSASISQSNVAGLESSLSSLDSEITTGLSGLSDDVEAVSDRVTSLENATTGDLQLNNTYFQISRSYWYKDNNMVEINIEARARGSVGNPTLWSSGALPASVTPPRYIYGLAIVKENPSSTTFTTVPFEIGSSNGASILGSINERNVIYINIVYSLWQED